MKKVYAIAFGLSDGMTELGGRPWHDPKAAAFAQVIREMLLLSKLVGGEPSIALGCTGVGDPER
ncbi:MAG: hypothetical protein M3170_02320 [Candidatus Dormibacteraeota bacterium]|nr:hypothetical protein [Candidatus Dormibacteraeota bacterium]